MEISLLDNSLKVKIYYDECDCEFKDNICVSFIEDCPDDEKIFRGDETNIYLTPEQAADLAHALIMASRRSQGDAAGEQ